MHPDTQVSGFGNSGVRANNVLVKIWLHPRATLRYILVHCPYKHVTQLFLLGGIARAVGRISGQHAADVSGRVLLAATVGGAFGWLTFWAYAWGLSLTGQWPGGRATTALFRTVVAWALLPTVLSLLPTGLALDIQSENAFRREVLDLPISSETQLLILASIQLLLAAWTVAIMLSGIQLVQGFSWGRAVLNMLLPGGILVAVIGVTLGLMKLLEMAAA